MLASISSEGSDDAPEELEGISLADAGLAPDRYLHVDGGGSENRQRRTSRAPEETAGRAGVWGMSEVARELRELAGDVLWELAVQAEEQRLAEVALQEGAKVIDLALLLAAWHGLTQLTTKLLACGASPNTCDPKGR